MDVLGAVVLFFALIVVGAMQVGAALGVMYGMHKLYPDKLTETTYGAFDFDHFQKPAFQDLLIKLVIVFIGSTLILHMLDYVLIGRLIVKYGIIIYPILFLFEVAAIGFGLKTLFHLDRFRLVVLTAASAVFYLFCLLYLAAGKSFLI